MVFTGQYVFEGATRWNLGWPNPNYAGAFIACLLPWIWAARSILIKQRDETPECFHFFDLIIVGDIFVCYCLCKTYSRGAVLATILALLGYSVSIMIGERASLRTVGIKAWPWFRQEIFPFVIRISALACFAFTTGLGHRIAKSVTENDAAVTNRVAFWKAATEMMALSPFHGWGAGESGRSYDNWFESPDRAEGFMTPVNSFLHVGIEFGLPIMALAVFLSLYLVLVGFRNDTTEKNENSLLLIVCQGAAGTLLSWSIANIFTTLWIEPYLWILPSVAIAIIIFSTVGKDKIKIVLSRAILSFFGTVVLTVSLYGVGYYRISETKIIPRPQPTGGVVLFNKGSHDEGRCALVGLDDAVLGHAPGKELRRWLSEDPEFGRVEVLPDTAPINEPISADGVFLFGRHAARIAMIRSSGAIWLIHPLGRPPQLDRKLIAYLSAQKVRIFLPAIDEHGDAACWARFAQLISAEVRESPSSGEDIRALWPGILVSAFSTPG